LSEISWLHSVCFANLTLPILLYNIYNIHDCLLTEKCQTWWICSSAVASPSDIIC